MLPDLIRKAPLIAQRGFFNETPILKRNASELVSRIIPGAKRDQGPKLQKQSVIKLASRINDIC